MADMMEEFIGRQLTPSSKKGSVTTMDNRGIRTDKPVTRENGTNLNVFPIKFYGYALSPATMTLFRESPAP